MNKGATTEAFLFGAFRLDRRAGALFRRDERGAAVPVAIGSRGFAVLDMLVARHGELVSKNEIMQAVWSETVVEDNNLTVQISALRRVLDDGRTQGSCIQTIPGRGYRFIPAVTLVDGDKIVGDGANIAAAEQISQPAVAPRLSIVVLPFANLGNDPEQQYFADGITEDLTTDLSRIEGMLVISRNTAVTYWGKQVDTKQIGRELCVRYVLEGSVRRSGSRIRVSAQLIDAVTDAHLWAERFDGDTGDLFALQDEITSRIAVALDSALITAEASRAVGRPDALDYILRGRAVWSKTRTREHAAEAISLLERALDLDPEGATMAPSYMAGILAGRVLDNHSETASEDLLRADELVTRALAQCPNDAYTHHAKGQLLRAQNRLPEAVEEYEIALKLNRNLVGAYAHIGRCKLLTGEVEEAIARHEQAMRLSPRDPDMHLWFARIGQARLVQLRLDEALLWFEKARNANPAYPGHHGWLAAIYALKEDTNRAAAELADARRLSGDNRFSTIAKLQIAGFFAVPAIRALFEPTFFAGLRRAGVPEE